MSTQEGLFGVTASEVPYQGVEESRAKTDRIHQFDTDRETAKTDQGFEQRVQCMLVVVVGYLLLAVVELWD